VPVVAPWLLQAIKNLDVCLDCLVAGSRPCFCKDVRQAREYSLVSTLAITTVSKVTLNHLIRKKTALQVASKDHQTVPAATLEWSIDPNYITSLNAHTNLVAKLSTPVLLHEPLLAEWARLPNLAIHAINSHQTCSSTVLLKPILKPNVQRR
jgi:hypothetical protein